MLAVSNRTQHIVLIVPAEGVHHVRNLVDFRLVDKSEEHITVVINKAHLAFA